MGMYDTLQQGIKPMGVPGGQPMQNSGNQLLQTGNGGSFAQKQQMRANPIMKRPAMGASFGQPNMSQRPNVMTGARPAMGLQPGMQGGSRDMMQQKMVQLKNAQAPQTIGGSYNELASRYPNLVENRQTGERAGADMSWMDRPGALQMSANPADYNKPEPQGPQSGLSPLQSPYERQIMESKPNAVMGAVQDGGAVGNMGRTFGRPMIQDRGIGPSEPFISGQDQMDPNPILNAPIQPQIQMDENGLEPRRGPR